MDTGSVAGDVETVLVSLNGLDRDRFIQRLMFGMSAGHVDEFGIAAHGSVSHPQLCIYDSLSGETDVWGRVTVRGWLLDGKHKGALRLIKSGGRLRELNADELVRLETTYREKSGESGHPNLSDLPTHLTHGD